MAKYLIEGGYPLKGKIRTAGNKNAILPCLAASLLTSEEIVLTNVPQILDVEVMLQILKEYGVKVKYLNPDTISLMADQLSSLTVNQKIIEKLRASVLLLGPLLARLGEVSLYHPGGDIIGRRSIQNHLEAFKKMGAEFSEDNSSYQGKLKDYNGGIIFLEETSVTATENILLCASFYEKVTIIKNAACEPHIVCLCELLNKMGAHIEGVGSNLLKINGCRKLRGVTHSIRPDHIETGTWIIASAVTGGEIEIENCLKEDLEMMTIYFRKMGINLSWKDQTTILIKPSKLKAIPKIDANIWPNFPTDLISPMIVLATKAQGRTLIHDWMYEGRMFFVDKLIRMGGNIVISDPHRVVVFGDSQLFGREIISPDIRAGIALVIAALCARGKSIIHRGELIERGYEKIAERLSILGAKIERVED